MIILSGASASTLTVAEVPFNGKKGEALLQAVAAASRPATTADRSKLTFTMTDEFTGRTVAVDAGQLPDGYEWGCLVADDWWVNSVATYGVMTGSDVYNLVPLDRNVETHRRDLPPAESVAKPEFDNGLWSAGRTVLYGVETEVYAPPVALRGELARAMMYMSAVYHVDAWNERASMIMDWKAYPGLTDYAIPLLMAWHRDNPPSAREIEKNERGERLQGNRNPFVDYPELAEYIWGTMKDEQFTVEGEPQPLRSTYSLTDERIDLYSPEVPSDAVWTVNGMNVESGFVVPADLGAGMHKLGYTSPSTREVGMVMIKIEKK